MLSANAVPKCKGLMHTAKQPEITLHGATFSSVCVFSLWAGQPSASQYLGWTAPNLLR